MKFHVEIDCTPEEVRRLIGLPDMSALHESYQTQLKDMMSKGVTPDILEGLVKSWSPMGQNGFDLLRSILSPLGSGKAAPTGEASNAPDRKS
jgi:hypothetical protein